MGKLILLPSVTCCRVSISRRHELSHIARHILTDPTHVLNLTLSRRYDNVLNRSRQGKQEGLWVDISPKSISKGIKNAVKRWSKRRFAQALFKELRNRGYRRGSEDYVLPRKERPQVVDMEMSTIQNIKDVGGVSSQPKDVNELRGTVSVQLLDALVNMKGEEIRRQTSSIADEVVRRCGISTDRKA